MADSGDTTDRRREETRYAFSACVALVKWKCVDRRLSSSDCRIPPEVYKGLLKAAGAVKFNFDEETLLAGLQEHGIEHKQHNERARYKSPKYPDIRGHNGALSIILGETQPAKGKQSASKQQTTAAAASQASRQTPQPVLGAVSTPTKSVSAFPLEHEEAESVSASPATRNMADSFDQPQQAGKKYALRSAQKHAVAPTLETAATPETLGAAWEQGASAEADHASPIQPTTTPQTSKFVSYYFGDSGQTGKPAQAKAAAEGDEAAQAKAGQGNGIQEHGQHDAKPDTGVKDLKEVEAIGHNQPCASGSDFQQKLCSAVSKRTEAFMTHVQQVSQTAAILAI